MGSIILTLMSWRGTDIYQFLLWSAEQNETMLHIYIHMSMSALNPFSLK